MFYAYVGVDDSVPAFFKLCIFIHANIAIIKVQLSRPAQRHHLCISSLLKDNQLVT